MFDADVRFPVWTGDVLEVIRDRHTDATVQRQRPDVMPAKTVTLRSDGGTTGQTLATIQGGVNIWAVGATAAENLAADVAYDIRSLPGLGVLKAVTVSLPFEVEDDPALTFNGDVLTHYYFAFSGVLKGDSASS